MATPSPPPALPSDRPIRISQIADKYYLFNLDDVMRLRRQHGMCGVLVGITPQAPNQNVFSGLPLLLRPEEARLLLDKGVAVIADDPRVHLQCLAAMSGPERQAFVEAHMARRAAAQRTIDEETAARTRAAMTKKVGKVKPGKRRATASSSSSTSAATPSSSEDSPNSSIFSSPASLTTAASSTADSPLGTPSRAGAKLAAPRMTPCVALTQTTSQDLLGLEDGIANLGVGSGEKLARPALLPRGNPLYACLHRCGFFMTPGIRFGGRYSVYPGDPFRYHAHFIAESYDWDQKIPMLDLVGTGRLAGAVKKGLLLGAEDPDGEDAGGPDGGSVRTFSVEWAAM